MAKAEFSLIALGAAIRRQREGKQLSQEELAKRCGIHRTYIGGVERGERNPTVKTLSRIASALEVPLSELIKIAEEILKE